MSAPSIYLVSPVLAEPPSADLPPYAAALGLTSNPFPVTPDEINYFFTPQNEAIYEEVSHFIAMRKGFLLLTGEIGLGKTTLLRRLLAAFDRTKYNTALILTSFLDQAELLETIARDFGLQLPTDARRIDHLAALNQFLLAEAAVGKINVLFIDDAQALDAQALDVVRQLSNLETAHSKLIQVVLCGQPELLDTLGQHSLRQVKSRIALHRQLQPLSLQQTMDYIRHRLTKAGRANCVEITPDGLQTLHERTAGFPRRIHHLMDRCLYGLLTSDSSTIDGPMAQRAFDDLGWQAAAPKARPADDQARPGWLFRHGALLGFGLVMVCALLLAAWLVVGDQRVIVLPAGTAVPRSASSSAIKPVLLAAPTDWATAGSAFAGLENMAWPAVSSVPALTEEIRRALQAKPWQMVLAQGEWVNACTERPMLTFSDMQGISWRLSFVESQWPTAPVPMGLYSEPVWHLQKVLVTQGLLDVADIDGLMGPRTATAMARFQREQGIAATGQFSAATAYRLSCQVARSATPAGGKAP
jgi:general secretion pathway protein A